MNLKRLFFCIIFFFSFNFSVLGTEDFPEEWENLNPILATPIESLDWNTRLKNVLRFEEIYYIGALVTRTERDLLKTSNLNRRDRVEIKKWLAERGLYLGMDINWPINQELEAKLVERLSSQESRREERVLTLVRKNYQITISALSQTTNISKYQIGRIVASAIINGQLESSLISENKQGTASKKSETQLLHFDSIKEIMGRILTLVMRNPQISIDELLKKLSVSEDTVNLKVDELEETDDVEERIEVINEGQEEIIQEEIEFSNSDSIKIARFILTNELGISGAILDQVINLLNKRSQLRRISSASNK